MTYKLHMNGVITGSLNSFCLACDVFLKCQQEAYDHIGTSEHKKKSGAVQYSDKFQDEHIKKFKWGYYCKFCNLLLPVASKVNLHITEDEHKLNKGSLLLKPMGGDVVAFNNILIEEKAWHGLIDGVCSLCNIEFEDETEHKTDASHSLNLVLKPIQFGADKAIFRHLDDTAVQCLTCNKLLAPARMTKHFDDTEHHERYVKRRIETNGVCQRTDTKEDFQGSDAEGKSKDEATNMTLAIENDVKIKKQDFDHDIDKDSNKQSPTKDKSKILESISRYQSKGININLETETAFCKKCSKVVAFDFIGIENHIENHLTAKVINSDLLYPSNLDQHLNRVDINDKTTQSSDDKLNTKAVNDVIKALQDNVQNTATEAASNEEDNDTNSSTSSVPPKENFETCSQEENDEEDNDNDSKSQKKARDFAKGNKITYNGDNNQSFCRICEVHVPPSFRSLKEHVEGANHKKLVASSTTQSKTPVKLVKQSMREFVQSAYDAQGMLYTASIINEKFCILRDSFYFLSENSSRIRCIVCEINLPTTSDVQDHVKTRLHAIRWLGVPVIISEKKEFIREVRPGLYHCGYCNLVVAGWDVMKSHLECSDHRDNRTLGENRMRFHYPNLQRFKMQSDMEAMAVINLFDMFN